MSASAIQTQDAKFATLGLSKMTVNDTQVCCYSRGLGTASEKNPILVLIHGYPSSSYTWRHLIPLLPSNAPIFMPDLPGYGASSPIKDNDKLTVGQTILSALQTEAKRSSSGSPSANIPVILIGHDRGARIAHRLAVSGAPGFNILAINLIDIVPTTTQWKAASNPSEIVGYFHWPFLANVELATKLITAFGGDNWCQELILRWAGTNKSGIEKLKEDEGLAVQAEFFNQLHTIEASCLDYRAGATTDVEAQEEDQRAGRKIPCPVLLLYSKQYIGARYDVEGEWKEWVGEGVEVQSFGLGDGIGHFGHEEAPEVSAGVIAKWLERVVRSG